VIALAVGQAETVGVAFATVTLTEPAAGVLLSVVSVGVKVTLSERVPVPGAVPGVVQAKAPPTEAAPPDNVDEASVWP
jgi:hypothetical protein